MIQAWKNDQRVKTLKIVIQVRDFFSSNSSIKIFHISGLQIISRYECNRILSK
jgi:hypothetical protein